MPDRTSDYTEDHARIDLAAAYRLAVNNGFDEGICNHFTMMIPGRNDQFLLIPYGLHWSEVKASDLLIVDVEGNTLSDTGIAEMTAVNIHAPIHRLIPKARCILHTHMPYATAIASLNKGRLLMCNQTAAGFYDRVAYDDQFSGLADTKREGERMAAAIGDKPVLFLGGHGVVVIGDSVAAAFNDLYYLERACRNQVLAMSTGAPLMEFSDELARYTAQQFADVELASADYFFTALKRLLLKEAPDYVS